MYLDSLRKLFKPNSVEVPPSVKIDAYHTFLRTQPVTISIYSQNGWKNRYECSESGTLVHMGGKLFLIINAGSSSIKFSLFDAEDLVEHYSGSISGIGFTNTVFRVTQDVHEIYRSDETIDTHEAAAAMLCRWLETELQKAPICAVGHRIVHGGSEFVAPCTIDESVVSKLRELEPLDPEHLPTQLALIMAMQRELPGVQQIACFDTALFHDLPANAQRLPIPRALETQGVRRYGFHGLSYSFLLDEFARVAGTEAAHGKIIMAHLGNGASLAAFDGGKPVDTSMGMTPAGGIPMSTRSGDLDPGVLTYLMRSQAMNPDQLDNMIGFESGLLGISETSSDMKQLLDIEASDSRAKEAVDMFCYQTRKFIGAYAAALGGLHSLIFSGGIGQVSAPIRARICDGLEFLGIGLDSQRNAQNMERISAENTAVGVHVLFTNEARTIAKEMQQIIDT